MRRKNFLLSFTLATFLLSYGYAQPNQNPYPNPFAAIVDVQKVVESCTAFKKLQDKLNKKMQEYQTHLRQEETRVSKGMGDSEAQKRKLAQEKSKLQAKATAYGQTLEVAFADAMAKLQRACTEIIEKICTARGIPMALAKGNVIWSFQSWDITPLVIAQLNAQLLEIPTTLDAQTPLQNASGAAYSGQIK